MAQVKIYPSTQAQVQAVQDTVDEINAKIPTPIYQVKTVTPSNVQQTVQADTGYTALSGVVVNPQTMPENLNDFIMNTSERPYDIELTGAAIPSYALANKKSLRRVNGDDVASSGQSSFENDPALVSIRLKNLRSTGSDYMCNNSSLNYVDFRKVGTISRRCFYNTPRLKLVDLGDRDTPPTLEPTAFNSAHINTIVAVKNSDVKTLFLNATNWAAFVGKIMTISEIETEVGMTYNEYYYQCFGRARNEATE